MPTSPSSDTGNDFEWLVNQIAHALRSPVFAAMVQAETIQLHAGSAERIARSGRMLHEQLKRLTHTIDEMLLFGRPAPIQRAPTDVSRLLRRLETFYRSDEGEGPAEITVEDRLQDAKPRIDEQALDIILHRLVDNAIQHTPPPHVVEITAEADGGRLRLEVRDHGDGIDPSLFEKALLPFYPQHRGRPGLGLAVAVKFARALDGHLELESTPGRGTTARCELPIDPEPVA